jgi:predicted XRE-type DNA-binding protein
MCPSDDATIEALRGDLALQVARFARRLGGTQTTVARRLRIPQPTLSKIMNGRVSDISMELLIRIAVRAGVSIAIHTGRAPEEAGVFLSSRSGSERKESRSRLADEAREFVLQSESRLTPSERLEAFLEHNQLVSALHEEGRRAERRRRSAP